MRAALAAGLVGVVLVSWPSARAEKAPKPKKPKVTVRALPEIAFAPAEVLVIVELKGGDEIEELYCPELEVDWDDGGKSIKESDCAPFEAGVTKLARRMTASHLYRRGGVYELRVRLRRADKTVASGRAGVTIRAGASEFP
jgi:hypothetical protein